MAIDFWFSIGSTYSFLTVMRLRDVSSRVGIPFVWHPFNVRAIMREMGNSPFAGKPAKLDYMWRDIKRRSEGYGIKARLPAPYPIHKLELANAVAAIAAREGWCEAYTVASYKYWFQDGEEPGTEPNLSASIKEAGQLPQEIILRAVGSEGIDALAEATDAAKGLGIFGSPNFVVGGDLFWGDDRLEDAILSHRRQGL